MPELDLAALRKTAERVNRSAGWLPILYAVLAFGVGVPLGGTAVVALNGMVRLNQIRSHEDVSELVHSEEKGDEVRSLFRRAPIGGLAMGIVLAGIGALAGARRRDRERLLGQTALLVADLRERLPR